MANFIPILEFSADEDLRVIFDSPPEGDPQSEQIANEKEQVRSVGGRLYTADFYDYSTFNLRFILQSNTVALKLKQLFRDYALKGQTFTYQPHSDDASVSHRVELQSESVQFNRDYPDGQGGFLWSFEFSLISVRRTAPRIVRGKVDVMRTPRPPGPIRNLSATNVEDTTATLNWNPPVTFGTSRLKHYVISDGARSFTTTEETFNLTGLSHSTQYTISIKVVNQQDLESPGVDLAITTAARVQPLSAVRNLAARSTGETSIFLAWLPPDHNGGSAITGYEVERIVSGGSNISQTVTNDHVTITGLSHSTSYSFRVRAVNADGNGPWSATVSATTDAPPQPMAPSTPTLNSLNFGLVNGQRVEAGGLVLNYDWPSDHAENLTQFKIYHYSTDDRIVRSFTVSAPATPSAGNRDGLDLSIGSRLIPSERFNPVTLFVAMAAVNATGESARTPFRNITLGRTLFKTVDGTTLTNDGGYVYTDKFGESDARQETLIDYTDSSEWVGTGSFPSYTPNTIGFTRVIAMQPSLTESDEMAAIVFVRDSSNTLVRRIFLLKLKVTRDPDNFHEFISRWVIKNQIVDASSVNCITAYAAENGTVYLYLKYHADEVIFTRPNNFASVGSFTLLSHASTLRNVGCAFVVGSPSILYVIDWYSDFIYAYDFFARARMSSKDISLQNFLYPYSLWSNSLRIWTLGSTAFQRNRTRRSRVYCYNLESRVRDTTREFNLDSRTETERYRDSVSYHGLCVRANYFWISRGIRKNVSPTLTSTQILTRSL